MTKTTLATADLPLLTIPDVARQLRICQQTAYRLCWSGDLKSVKIAPKVLRVHPLDLARYIEGKTN